jgi:hypothetical protein
MMATAEETMVQIPRGAFGWSAIATPPTFEAPDVPGPAVQGGPYEAFFTSLGEDWIAVSYVAIQGRELVVAELRVVPRSAAPVEQHGDGVLFAGPFRHGLAYWSCAPQGFRTDVPAGGITRTLLRSIPSASDFRDFRSRLRQHREQPIAQVLRATRGTQDIIAPEINLGRKGPGRRPLTRADLLPVAVAYDRAVRRGSRQPTKDVAAALRMRSEATARNWVHRARKAGLLEEAVRRVAGGGLTPEGRALRASERRRSTRRRARSSRTTTTTKRPRR